MKYLVPAAAALLFGPAAVAQTTSTQTTTPTDQASPMAQPSPSGTMTSPSPTGTTPIPATGAPVKPSVGATVYGSGGTPVGTIKSMDAQFVTLTTPKGDIRLPAAGVGPGPNGPVVALTADQLSTAIDQAKAAQPVATSSTTSAATSDAPGTTTTRTTAKRTRRR